MNIEVKLGGEVRQLRATMGAFRHIKDITGKDPFDWSQDFSGDPFAVYDAVRITVLAGLRCYWDFMKKEYEKDETILQWIDDLNPTEAGAIVQKFFDSLNKQEEPSKNGKAPKQIYKNG